jgi:hypothetical protein
MCASSVLIISCFCFVGIFGYASFVNEQGQLCSENILQATSYDNVNIMQSSRIGMLFSVIAGFPISMIPSKDSIEDLFFKGE